MILFCLILLGAGGAGGWYACRRIGYKKLIDDNSYLQQRIAELKLTLTYWQEQSAYNKEVQNSTISNHNSNMKNTLETTLVFLQNQNKENMKAGEKEQIETIIKNIKGISHSNG